MEDLPVGVPGNGMGRVVGPVTEIDESARFGEYQELGRFNKAVNHIAWKIKHQNIGNRKMEVTPFQVTDSDLKAYWLWGQTLLSQVKKYKNSY